MTLVVHNNTATRVWWAKVGDRLRILPHIAPRRTRGVLGGSLNAGPVVHRSRDT